MPQKVLRVGTSAAVTIPKSALAELGLKPGDSVNVEVSQNGRQVVIEPAGEQKPDRELAQWTKSFIQRYHGALKALAKK